MLVPVVPPGVMKGQIKGGCEAFTDPADGGKIHSGCLTSRPEPGMMQIPVIPGSGVADVDPDGSVVHLRQVLFTSCQLVLITSCFPAGAIDGLQEPLTVDGSDAAPNGPTQRAVRSVWTLTAAFRTTGPLCFLPLQPEPQQGSVCCGLGSARNRLDVQDS